MEIQAIQSLLKQKSQDVSFIIENYLFILVDFTRKIFGNLFRNNQSKLLDATQSAFDFKKFRKDESKNPASFVMD